MKTKIKVCILSFTMLLIAGCENFINIDLPDNKLGKNTVFLNENTAESALNGLYESVFSGIGSGGSGSVSFLASILSDEIKVNSFSNSTVFEEINRNQITPLNSIVLSFWTNVYSSIYMANSIVEELNIPNALPKDFSNQIQAEARCIRAFVYFNATQLFNDLPLVLTTDYRYNQRIGLTTQEEIINAAANDLELAIPFLTDLYLGKERTRINKSAAKALLARIRLYQKRWEEAERLSTEVINNKSLYSLEENLDMVFLIKSKETIWHRLPRTPQENPNEITLFTIGQVVPYQVNASLIESFEVGDNRKENWFRTFQPLSGEKVYVPFKYKSTSSTGAVEYSIILRLSEQYLIRAEARAQLGKYELAIEDVNRIRARAGIPYIQFEGNKDWILQKIMHERRCELFTEWGHRWFDLLRTNQALKTIMNKRVGITEKDLFFPIPETERLKNPNL